MEEVTQATYESWDKQWQIINNSYLLSQPQVNPMFFNIQSIARCLIRLIALCLYIIGKTW